MAHQTGYRRLVQSERCGNRSVLSHRAGATVWRAGAEEVGGEVWEERGAGVDKVEFAKGMSGSFAVLWWDCGI